jgi:hypothetical protein
MKLFYYLHYKNAFYKSFVVALIFSSLLIGNQFAKAQTLPEPILRTQWVTYWDILVEWELEGDSEDATVVVIEKSFGNTDNFTVVDTVSVSDTPYYHHSGIPKCGDHFYRIRLYNDKGESRISNIAHEVLRISPARNFKVNPHRSNYEQIALEWYHSNYADYLRLERAENEEGPYTILENRGIEPGRRIDFSFIDDNIVPGRRYYYRLSATINRESLDIDDCQSEYVYLTTSGARPIIEFPLKLALKKLFKLPIIRWNKIPIAYTHWLIERSDYKLDEFKEIGKVMGSQLSFEDTEPFQKDVSYYRVLAMNEDKVVAISEVVSSEDATEEVVQESIVYPNPFKESFKLTAAKAAFIKDLKLLSEKGNEEALEWKQLDEETLEVALKQILPEGVYFIHIHRTDSKEVEKVRLVKEK